MTTLVNQNGPSNKKKGRSRKGHILSAAVQKATEHFIIQGKQIAQDYPEAEKEVLAAVEEIRKAGKFWLLTLSQLAALVTAAKDSKFRVLSASE